VILFEDLEDGMNFRVKLDYTGQICPLDKENFAANLKGYKYDVNQSTEIMRGSSAKISLNGEVSKEWNRHV
jgi:hypothetical protein